MDTGATFHVFLPLAIGAISDLPTDQQQLALSNTAETKQVDCSCGCGCELGGRTATGT